MVVVVVLGSSLLMYDALDLSKLRDVAWDGDGAIVAEPVLLLSFLQQTQEKGVVDVDDRDDESLLLPPLPHHHRHTPSRYIL